MITSRFFLLCCVVGALSGCASAADRGNGPGKEPPANPPATSRDAIAPSGGALIGGSIDTAAPPNREVRRCQELAGTLRAQCLRDAQEQAIVPVR